MRLAVIDDHPLVRDGVSILIEAIPGEHSAKGFDTLDAFDADLAAGSRFDLVLLDLGIPGCVGLESLERYRGRHEDTPVVVLSALSDRDTILKSLDLGAMGFIPKTSRREVLLSAIELVASGGIYVPPEALSRSGGNTAPLTSVGAAKVALASGEHASPFGEGAGLTLRQREVLNLLIKGLPNKLICRELNLSPNTVKSHLSAIFRVLDVANRTQAVIAAQRLGIRVRFGSAESRA